MDTWTTVLFGALQSAVARMGLVVPRLLALGVWSVVGWGVATLARRVGVRLLQALAFDHRCLRWGVTPALGRLGIRQGPIYLVGYLPTKVRNVSQRFTQPTINDGSPVI